MIVIANRRMSFACIVIVFLSAQVGLAPTTSVASPVAMLSGTAVARGIMKYFGKEGTEDATEY